MKNTTYAVELTGPGRGAVATVLLQGPAAVQLVAERFQSRRATPVEEMSLDQISLGIWRGCGTEEELVICRTRQDEFEIHCHGGRTAVRSVLDSLAGGASELTIQQWLEGSEMDPFLRLAQRSMPLAATETTLRVLLAQVNGAMRRLFECLIARLEVGQTQVAIEKLQRCLGFADVGKHLTTPYRVVVVGPPNTGKSSLINALVGYERTVVFDQPGTTRDVVQVTTAIDGWLFEIMDTAGIRETPDAIEAEGMRRARLSLEQADLALVVHDLSGPTSHSIQLPPCVIPLHVGTKLDLAAAPSSVCAVSTSAHERTGIDELLSLLVRTAVPRVPGPNDAVPLGHSMTEPLAECLQLLQAGQRELTLSRLKAMLVG